MFPESEEQERGEGKDGGRLTRVKTSSVESYRADAVLYAHSRDLVVRNGDSGERSGGKITRNDGGCGRGSGEEECGRTEEGRARILIGMAISVR